MDAHRCSKDCMERSRRKNLFRLAKVLAILLPTEPLDRMAPRYGYGIWLGVRSNGVECYNGIAERAFRARDVRRLEPQKRWDKEAINNNISVVPWRLVDGKWSVDKQVPEAKVEPLQPPPIPFARARVPRVRITKRDIDAFGTKAAGPG